MSLDALYDNRAAVPEFPDVLARWQAESVRAQSGAPNFSVHDYLSEGAPGSVPLSGRSRVARALGTNRCRVHFFSAASKEPRPVLIFFHGGYWRSLGPEFFYFIAPPWNTSGVHVALVGYDLCPEVGIDQITEQSFSALRWMFAQSETLGIDRKRMVVSGHSAGGHLATMVVSASVNEQGEKNLGEQGDQEQRLKFKLSGCLSLSGVFDLSPLMQTAMNADLRINTQIADHYSPLRRRPLPYILLEQRLAVFVGGAELSGFHDQHKALICAWGLEGRATVETLPGLNHFTMLDALISPESTIFKTAKRMMGVGATL
jgi:arylformamidase